MTKQIVTLLLAMTIGGASVAFMLRGPQKAALANATPAMPVSEPTQTVIAAIGRVEPVSEEIKIGSQLAGRLSAVLVEEGQRVALGQIIAQLDHADYAARVKQSRANIELRQAELDRIVNGSRAQERQEAAGSVAEARAVLNNARTERDRRKNLFDSGDISRSDFERADREYQVAEARLLQVTQHSAFVDAPARDDERARAAASIELAKAQLAEAEALLEKTSIRAPIAGVVLKRYHRTGELVSDKGDPIVSFGDVSRLRVRVDVDETDVAKIHVGDTAYFTARAFGKERFPGKVVQIGRQLGKKNLDTGDPAEKIDTKVLETLVDLDGHPALPSGLRVDAFIGGK
jgi:HlyD family secretion protein